MNLSTRLCSKIIHRSESPLLAEVDRLREENEQLREALGLNVEIPAELGLTPAQRKLAAIMLRRDRPTREGMHMAIQAIRGSRKDMTDPKMVDVMVYKMRKKLAPMGIQIQTDRGFGYFMTSESKAKLRAIIAAAI